MNLQHPPHPQIDSKNLFPTKSFPLFQTRNPLFRGRKTALIPIDPNPNPPSTSSHLNEKSLGKTQPLGTKPWETPTHITISSVTMDPYQPPLGGGNSSQLQRDLCGGSPICQHPTKTFEDKAFSPRFQAPPKTLSHTRGGALQVSHAIPRSLPFRRTSVYPMGPFLSFGNSNPQLPPKKGNTFSHSKFMRFSIRSSGDNFA